ncbi:MAG: hypothetical protein JSS02_11915 [Planctomycetes bacterium]|nr:hypothetical protein [Planctomycetota bacterium]
MWLLPLLILAMAVGLSFPVGKYLAWVMDGRLLSPSILRWVEARVNSGPQNWKQYTFSLM